MLTVTAASLVIWSPKSGIEPSLNSSAIRFGLLAFLCLGGNCYLNVGPDSYIGCVPAVTYLHQLRTAFFMAGRHSNNNFIWAVIVIRLTSVQLLNLLLHLDPRTHPKN